MSLLIAKCTWNFPPNLQWLKAKMTILHLPPKLNNLLLVKKKESVCIKGQYSARYCETEERIKQNERQYWCMILSPLKNIIPEWWKNRGVKRCTKMWLLRKIKFCLWFPQRTFVLSPLNTQASGTDNKHLMDSSLFVSNLKNVSGTREELFSIYSRDFSTISVLWCFLMSPNFF